MELSKHDISKIDGYGSRQYLDSEGLVILDDELNSELKEPSGLVSLSRKLLEVSHSKIKIDEEQDGVSTVNKTVDKLIDDRDVPISRHRSQVIVPEVRMNRKKHSIDVSRERTLSKESLTLGTEPT